MKIFLKRKKEKKRNTRLVGAVLNLHLQGKIKKGYVHGQTPQQRSVEQHEFLSQAVSGLEA